MTKLNYTDSAQVFEVLNGKNNDQQCNDTWVWKKQLIFGTTYPIPIIQSENRSYVISQWRRGDQPSPPSAKQ